MRIRDRDCAQRYAKISLGKRSKYQGSWTRGADEPENNTALLIWQHYSASSDNTILYAKAIVVKSNHPAAFDWQVASSIKATSLSLVKVNNAAVPAAAVRLT